MADTVTVNFDLDEFLEDAEEAIEAALAEGVEFAERELLRRIPASRVETRRHVKSETEDELTAQVGVEFPAARRYPARGTKTERIVQNAWYSTELPTFRAIEASFNQRIED